MPTTATTDAAPAGRLAGGWRTTAAFAGVTALSMVATLVLMCLLPHSDYLRYIRADETQQYPKTRWIYERIHFDPTPIDVAFFGSSRTGGAIQTAIVEEALAREGIAAHAVNFNLPQMGRNLHYALVKELLESRDVPVIVLEVTEIAERHLHPQFSTIADAGDILEAPVIGNLRYARDLVALPGRQLDLFLRSLPQTVGLEPAPRFEPGQYAGANLDRGDVLIDAEGNRKSRDRTMPEAELRAAARRFQAGIDDPLLPEALAEVEFGANRFYIRRIIALARAHGTRLVFLYLPSFGAPPEPAERSVWGGAGPVLTVHPLVQESHLWLDETHVNWTGSQIVSRALGPMLAPYVRPDLDGTP
ncbi:MAG: hypothetical protein HXY25_06690 [Alphaproteobacteria bacterium]|nr:hypothetical protein [Alphaproteobacteria bacterium]